MKKLIVVILITGLCSMSLGAPSNFKVIALQFLGGLAGEACCYVPAYGLFLWSYNESWSSKHDILVELSIMSTMALIALSPYASATGVRLVGNHYYNKPERGSTGFSILGAYIGGISSVGILIVSQVTASTIPFVAIPAISIGAVLGYQLNRRKTAQHSFLNDHLQPPSIGLKFEKNKMGKTISALDIRLINARL